jgi:hypothetical protein
MTRFRNRTNLQISTLVIIGRITQIVAQGLITRPKRFLCTSPAGGWAGCGPSPIAGEVATQLPRKSRWRKYGVLPEPQDFSRQTPLARDPARVVRVGATAAAMPAKPRARGIGGALAQSPGARRLVVRPEIDAGAHAGCAELGSGTRRCARLLDPDGVRANATPASNCVRLTPAASRAPRPARDRRGRRAGVQNAGSRSGAARSCSISPARAPSRRWPRACVRRATDGEPDTSRPWRDLRRHVRRPQRG